jgi:hypothetical protein
MKVSKLLPDVIPVTKNTVHQEVNKICKVYQLTVASASVYMVFEGAPKVSMPMFVWYLK